VGKKKGVRGGNKSLFRQISQKSPEAVEEGGRLLKVKGKEKAEIIITLVLCSNSGKGSRVKRAEMAKE